MVRGSSATRTRSGSTVRGSVLVADRENNRIQVFTGDGDYLASWGDHYHPMDIYVDADGLIYVTDQIPRLSLLAPDGRLVGRCRPVLYGAHGVWGDSRSNLYLAEASPMNRITGWSRSLIRSDVRWQPARAGIPLYRADVLRGHVHRRQRRRSPARCGDPRRGWRDPHRSAGRDRPYPVEAEVFANPGTTVMPGFIDGHVHLMFGTGPRGYDDVVTHDSDAVMLLRAVRNAELHLRAGVTTVRDAGARNRVTFDFETVSRPVWRVRRLLLCGRPLTITGGHFWWCHEEADGVDGVRAAARRLLKEA